MFRYLAAAATGCTVAAFVVLCVITDAVAGAECPHRRRKPISCTRTPQRTL
jgi:hypothetical protein